MPPPSFSSTFSISPFPFHCTIARVQFPASASTSRLDGLDSASARPTSLVSTLDSFFRLSCLHLSSPFSGPESRLSVSRSGYPNLRRTQGSPLADQRDVLLILSSSLHLHHYLSSALLFFPFAISCLPAGHLFPIPFVVSHRLPFFLNLAFLRI